MKAPHALVVAYDFPPHAAIGTMRTLRVVRQLSTEGWRVTVITSEPSSYRPGTAVDEALLAQVPAGVRIVRAGTFRGFESLKSWAKSMRTRRPTPPHPGVSHGRGIAGRKRSSLAKLVDAVDGVLAIPDQESGWLLPAVRAAMQATATDQPDVLFSSAPPWTGQLVALVLSHRLGCPWVADFRDPWARAPWRDDRSRLARWGASLLERQVVRTADRVVFVAQGNREDFERHYPATFRRKFVTVSNGCDPAEFEGLNAGAASVDPFVLLHAGSLYAGRTPLPLFRALARAISAGLIDPSRFRLRFLGAQGMHSVDLPGAVRELGLERVVEFASRVPRRQGLQAMAQASGLLLLQPGHTASVPGKLYEYMALGRPIFAVAEEGETAELVRKAGHGVSVIPDDEDAISEALVAFLRYPQGLVKKPDPGLFDGMLRARELVQLLGTIVQTPRDRMSSAPATASVESESTTGTMEGTHTP